MFERKNPNEITNQEKEKEGIIERLKRTWDEKGEGFKIKACFLALGTIPFGVIPLAHNIHVADKEETRRYKAENQPIYPEEIIEKEMGGVFMTIKLPSFVRFISNSPDGCEFGLRVSEDQKVTVRTNFFNEYHCYDENGNLLGQLELSENPDPETQKILWGNELTRRMRENDREADEKERKEGEEKQQKADEGKPSDIERGHM